MNQELNVIKTDCHAGFLMCLTSLRLVEFLHWAANPWGDMLMLDD